MQALIQRLPFLRWPRLTPELLRNELMASLTVAVVMVPQSVAYAGLAGMPLVTGLYATFLPALAAVLFGSSTRLSVGPSALSSVLVGASLLGLAQPQTPQWVALAVWLALLSGGMQLAVGLSHAAWVLNLVSSPVLAGFSQAAALLIIASQLPSLVGAQGSVLQWLQHPHVDLASLAFGVVSLAILMAGRKLPKSIPLVLLVVAVAGGVSVLTSYPAHGQVVGSLPAGLPMPYWPGVPGWETLSSLIAPALVIALVSSLEMAASARIESQHDGKRWDADQDLVGQGVGKIVSGLSGAFPTSTSFSRSALTLYSGAKTGWATVAATAVLLVVLLFLTPLLAPVPRAVLAAIVIAAVINLFRPHTLLALWGIGKVEAVTAGVTFAVTILSAPRIYWGVLTGVVMGLAHFLYHRLHPRIIEVGLHPDGSLRDRQVWQLPPLAPGLYALRMDSGLDFASAGEFERNIVEHLAGRPEVKHVCLFAHPINRIDATGVEVFLSLRRTLAARGITLHVSGVKLPVEKVLERAGALEPGPLLRLYRTDTEALQSLDELGRGVETD
ncbi:MAG TPA: SulP family inorganic anion transporter [Ramlibacter sp.]|uniref:SulP family inorganic anion transporter n=1 Tax=Ramlibacter sp. TaxID=1917967 RepID=UPI002BFD3AC4|nr:SulP family inorganic anion transporter [Ramlibacter sp.]HVZ42459.1 SulP family inorganic anion transporter [Ramlibacter sp.]